VPNPDLLATRRLQARRIHPGLPACSHGAQQACPRQGAARVTSRAPRASWLDGPSGNEAIAALTQWPLLM
jgi:hypothetical protein